MAELINGVEVSNISITYAKLIMDGVYTFDKVKKRFKSDCAVVLVAMDYEDKVTDETYLAEAKDRLAKAQENNE